MKLFSSGILMLLCTGPAFSQTLVHGKVIDAASRQPLEGGYYLIES